jgi:hypothetical protein
VIRALEDSEALAETPERREAVKRVVLASAARVAAEMETLRARITLHYKRPWVTQENPELKERPPVGIVSAKLAR